MRKITVDFNAPFTLTFTFAACLATIVGGFSDGAARTLFMVGAPMDWGNPFDYIRLFSYILGHADWTHFAGNFTLILLVGPILEEKYSTRRIVIMTLVTAVITGLLHAVFSSGGLMGASGIAFMLILLSSLTNLKTGSLPLTFVIVALLYGGNEIYMAITQQDNISQFAHLAGGVMGAIFGFFLRGK